jgi:hypothetical protein
MSGLEAIREIKKIKKMFCVVTSAFDHGIRITDTRNNIIPWTVCDFYLRKPLNSQVFNSIIQEVSKKST